jgi:uncharacterized protein YdaU (DUF1376 family)
MSRAFIAFYMGDYQKKTQHLDTLQHGAYFLLLQHCWTHGSIPPEPAGRAAIARLPLAVWKKNAAVINAFFDDNGCNKRATEEVEKAERISLKRAMAGQKGGFKSGISKSIARGQQLRSNEIANATNLVKQAAKQKPGNSIPIQKGKIINSSLGATREGVVENQQSRGSLATAHPEGALREPLSAETNRLLASLERIKAAKQATAVPADPVEQGKVWVDIGTNEWSAHDHRAKSIGMRMRLPITRTDERGVERTGAYFDSAVPVGYDEATGERIPASSEENAA